jgi:catechol 2,3-dioxygenase-like lactoylglutathione lyase family enzyme
MARLRYMTFISKDADALGRFYVDFFAMSEVSRSNEGDVTVTDGFFKFAIFQARPDLGELKMEIGAHHVGVEVESIDETLRLYREFDPRGVVREEPAGDQYGTIRIHDPENNPVVLSETGFDLPEPSARLPRMRHIALGPLCPENTFNFYAEVFGFRELPTSYKRRTMGKQNRFMGDGMSNLAMHPFYNGTVGFEGRYGINHFGFLIDDLDGMVAKLSRVVPTAKRPARPYEDYRVRDPEGNGIDLSYSLGFEIDVGKWDLVKQVDGKQQS